MSVFFTKYDEDGYPIAVKKTPSSPLQLTADGIWMIIDLAENEHASYKDVSEKFGVVVSSLSLMIIDAVERKQFGAERARHALRIRSLLNAQDSTEGWSDEDSADLHEGWNADFMRAFNASNCTRPMKPTSYKVDKFTDKILGDADA